jgi:branched-chain amino acid transport system substrate-binding protein
MNHFGKMAKAATAVIAFAAMCALTGCNRVPEVVKIGVAQPLSGPRAPLGTDLVNGVQLAIEEINASGGLHIDGQHVRLELVAIDDKADRETGKAAAQQLVAAGVLVAVADLNSAVSIAAAPIYANAGVPQLAISTKPEYTKLGLPTTLRLVANDDLQAKAMGAYAVQIAGVERVAVLDSGTPYSVGLAEGAAKVIARSPSHTLSLRRSVNDATIDFGSLIEELRSTKTQLVVSTLSDFQVVALIDQLAKAGMSSEMSILGGDTIKTDKLIGAQSKVKEIYVTSPVLEPSQFLAGSQFLAAFRARFKREPLYGAHYTYDAVYVVADALSRNGNVDKGKLLQRLKEFDGKAPVTNTMRFGDDGEQRYGAIGVYRLSPIGKWQPMMHSDRW